MISNQQDIDKILQRTQDIINVSNQNIASKQNDIHYMMKINKKDMDHHQAFEELNEKYENDIMKYDEKMLEHDIKLTKVQDNNKELISQINNILNAVSLKKGENVGTIQDAIKYVNSLNDKNLFKILSKKYGKRIETVDNIIQLIDQNTNIGMLDLEEKLKNSIALNHIYEKQIQEFKEKKNDDKAKQKANDDKKGNDTKKQEQNKTKKNDNIEEMLNDKTQMIQKCYLNEQEKNRNLQIKVEEYETTLSNLKLELNQKDELIEKRNNEISNLKEQLESYPKEDTEKILKITDYFDEIIDGKEKDFKLLCSKKDQLISLIQKMNSYISYYDNYCRNLTKEKNLYQMELQSYQEQTEEKLNENLNALESLKQKTNDILPEEITKEVNNYKDFPTIEYIYSIIQFLTESFKSKNVEAKGLKEGLTQRELALLGQLENLLGLLRSLTNSSSLSTYDQTIVNYQCSHISQFIDEEFDEGLEIEGQPSLFTAGNVKSKVNTLFNYLNQNDIENTPIKELYILFLIVLQVNSMLLDKVNSLINDSKDTDKINKVCDERNKFENEISKLKDEINIAKEKILELNDIKEQDNFFTILNELIDSYKNLLQENHLKQNKIYELNEKTLNEQKELETVTNERDEFCKKAKKFYKQVKYLKNLLKKEIKENKEQSNNYKQELENLSVKITEQSEGEKLELVLQNKESKLNKYKDLANKMGLEIKKLREENAMLKVENKEKNNENKLYCDKINNQNNEIKELQSKISNLQNKKYQIKEQNQKLQKNNDVTLENIQKENYLLHEKYDERIKELEEKMQNKQEENQELQSKISNLQSKISKSQVDISNMKLNELKLKSIISKANEKINMQEDMFNSKMKSNQMIYSQKLQEAQQKLINFTKNLQHMIENTFNISFEKPIDFPELLDIFSDLLNDSEIEQIFSIKEKLNIDSFINYFNQIKKTNEEQNINLTKSKTKIEKKEKEIQELNSQLKGAQKQNQEYKDWDKWGKSIYNKVTDKNPSKINGNELRRSLEELIYISIGDKEVNRTIEILREQKKMLLSKKFAQSLTTRIQRENNSLRPLILSTMFVNRLYKLSKNVESQFL